jgi:hypothetical protein
MMSMTTMTEESEATTTWYQCVFMVLIEMARLTVKHKRNAIDGTERMQFSLTVTLGGRAKVLHILKRGYRDYSTFL